MDDNLIEFPIDNEPVVTIDAIFGDLKEQGVTELVTFSRDRDGEVMVHGTHGLEATDDLIEEGLTEWESMIDCDDDEEDDDHMVHEDLFTGGLHPGGGSAV